ncbi:hypothetical protein EDB80DRAFT_591633 [Ilyonectria destructans]|nr:hypothetical protein EDB80DRAFT_591633 [Ilyonectria destructans]
MESAHAAPVPCGRCRERRVKCDRRQPSCTRCARASYPCPGYDRVRGFLDQGRDIRRKYGSDTTAGPTRTFPSTPRVRLSPPSPASPFGHDARPSPPSQSQSPAVPPPPPSNEVRNEASTGFDNTLDIDFDNDSFFDIDPAIYYAQAGNCCGFLPNVPIIDDTELALPLNAGNSFDEETFSAFTDSDDLPLGLLPESIRERELHTADLIKHYVDVISPWLDVFDSDRYFGHVVPNKIGRSLLVKDSLAAVAAKQFGNMRREQNKSGRYDSNRSSLDLHYRDSNIDWLYEAAGFYDKAIRRMIASLQVLRNQGPIMSNGSPTTLLASSQPSPLYTTPSTPGRHQQRTELETIDDLLAAVSIFLLYESLDDRRPSMMQHMSGAQHLLGLDFEHNPTSSLRIPAPTMQSDLDTTKAWRASFWNFACVDYVVSYAAKSKTQLDIADKRLWQAAGLPMNTASDGCVPESLVQSGDELSLCKMTETIACRSLIWIVLKTLNYVSVFVAEQNTDWLTSAGLSCWDHIHQHLDIWYQSLPEGFQPCLTSSLQRYHTHAERSSSSRSRTPQRELSAIKVPFPEIFYSNATGAATLLLYHFTRILLLLHKPPTHESFNPRNGIQRLSAYRQVSNQINRHAYEICSIALGRPQPAVQIQLFEPLNLAGRCLEENEQQVVVADLLVGLQITTGCSTEWRLTQLKKEWGWENVPYS